MSKFGFEDGWPQNTFSELGNLWNQSKIKDNRKFEIYVFGYMCSIKHNFRLPIYFCTGRLIILSDLGQSIYIFLILTQLWQSWKETWIENLREIYEFYF